MRRVAEKTGGAAERKTAMTKKQFKTEHNCDIQKLKPD